MPLYIHGLSMIEFTFFGEHARFHHIGLAVRSIEQANPSGEPVIDPMQKVSVSFARVHGVPFELIEPNGKDSPVARSIENGQRLVHVCYEVPDLPTVLKTCRQHGFHCISTPVPAAAFDNRRIAWVYSSLYGLFELLETAGQEDL